MCIMNTGIIIQARQGSTRFPGKMLKPFYNNESVLDILISKLKKIYPSVPLVLATTQNKEDDAIEELGNKHNVEVYRGSTENVLGRFIEAAEKNNLDSIIRICADNPFLDMRHIQILMDELEKGNLDYVSYQTPEGVPVIQSHLGLFAEAVSLDALKKVANQTVNPEYLEHVTNYIYKHPDEFIINFFLSGYFKIAGYHSSDFGIPKRFRIGKRIFQELGLAILLLVHFNSDRMVGICQEFRRIPDLGSHTWALSGDSFKVIFNTPGFLKKGGNLFWDFFRKIPEYILGGVILSTASRGFGPYMGRICARQG